MKIQNAKNRQNSPSGHHRTTLLGCIFATKACVDNQKQTCSTAVSPPDTPAPHNMANFGPLTAEIDLPVWGTQQISTGFARLAFITAATSLTGGQPNFARCLGVSWAGTLYIHFLGLLPPLTEFCPVQNSLSVQVLRSPILAALLHRIPAAGVSKTLRRGTRIGKFLRNFRRGLHLFCWAVITLDIGPHSSWYYTAQSY